MNFFAEQESAKRHTKLLVVLFALAVVGIATAIYFVVIAAITVAEKKAGQEIVHWFDLTIFLYSLAGTILFIFLGSLYKSFDLRSGGGAAVAEMLCGREIVAGSFSSEEKQLQNVVEEMAIASGCPVPRVYVMEDENGINAFAAGLHPSNAVIGVSKGALKRLDRNEMQAVVAHEFSHILNGDMLLNLKIIGILHGILLISVTGYYMMRIARFGRSSKNSGKIQAALGISGVCLMIIGWVGVFFGRIIKNAISREREYLADASSVQFTRNPAGLAMALKKIGSLSLGSWVRSHEAEEASHLFFGDHTNGKSFFSSVSFMATHPPLSERIKKLDPHWNGNFDFDFSVDEDAPQSESKEKDSKSNPLDMTTILPTAIILENLDQLRKSTQDPFEAWASLIALLANEDKRDWKTFVASIESLIPEGLLLVVKTQRKFIQTLNTQEKVVLIEMIIPHLQHYDYKRRQMLLDSLHAIAKSDDQVTLFEYLTVSVIENSLRNSASVHKPLMTKSNYRKACRIILSYIATIGTDEKTQSFKAYQKGIQFLNIPDDEPMFKVDLLNATPFSIALKTLEGLTRYEKSRFLKACQATIEQDLTVTDEEYQLVRMISLLLGDPILPIQ